MSSESEPESLGSTGDRLQASNRDADCKEWIYDIEIIRVILSIKVYKNNDMYNEKNDF